MGKRIFLIWALTTLLSLLSAKHSSGSFLSSLQFTRDALMDFSRGSQRTVDIALASKLTTKTVKKTYKITRNDPRFSSADTVYKIEEVKGINKKTSNGMKEPAVFKTVSTRESFLESISQVSPKGGFEVLLDPSVRKHLPKQIVFTWQVNTAKGVMETLLQIPFNKTVVENQTKHEVYRTRTSPSNKFMKAINDIELAQTNANASDVKYSSAALAKLKVLVERAIRSKSYKYARQVT